MLLRSTAKLVPAGRSSFYSMRFRAFVELTWLLHRANIRFSDELQRNEITISWFILRTCFVVERLCVQYLTVNVKQSKESYVHIFEILERYRG